jgi:hypothetical protein
MISRGAALYQRSLEDDGQQSQPCWQEEEEVVRLPSPL